MEYAFGGVNGIPEIPITILFCQEPEVLASNPTSSEYNPQVGEILKAARTRLKKNDSIFFGNN